MKKGDEGDSGGNRRRFPFGGVRAPVLVTLFVVGIVGAAYYAYYRKQAAYFAGRDLRLLSMITAQIAGRVDMYAGIIRAGERLDESPPRGDCPDTLDEKTFPRGRDLIETSDGWTIVLKEPATRCWSVPLDTLVAPVMARRVSAAFDMLIIAQEDGTVLYNSGRPDTTSTLLHQQEEVGDATNGTRAEGVGPALQLTTLKALSREKGWTSFERLDPAALTGATAQTNVDLGGDGYVLFSQPYTFARADARIGKKPPLRLIVCGLVSASRFRYDASAISTTLILVAVALALLALCGWPFLRIALIDPRQPLTITDVVLIVICTIVGAAVISLALLDSFAYRDMARLADDQLREYGKTLQTNFRGNVVRAMDMLAEAERATGPIAKAAFTEEVAELPCEKEAVLDVPRRELTDALFRGAMVDYPYVHTVLWIDGTGMQRVRFGSEGGALRCVSDRQYFQLAKKNLTWRIDERSYVLEWVRSKTTGEVRAVFAKPAEPPFAVVAVSTEVIDLTHAVGPPGVEMAIIAENGDVVYHSDPQRFGYENFFAETDHDRGLRAAVVARREEFVPAKYWGEDHSMYVQPLTDSPWTLVTFRPKRLTRVLNVEGALLTLVLLLMSATPYFLIYIVILLIFPRYRAPRLWPDISRTRDYLRLNVILVALLLLFWFDIYALAPWSSFLGALIIPTLAIVTAYLVLHRTAAPVRFNIGMAAWLAINALLVCHLAAAEVDAVHRVARFELVLKGLLILTALGTAALTLTLLKARSGPLADRLRALGARLGYSRLYRLCGALLLAVGVAMPVVAYFSIARRAESELMVKYAQLRAAADLEHRIGHLEELNVLKQNSAKVTNDLLGTPLPFFSSRWRLTLNGVPPYDDDFPAARETNAGDTIPKRAAGALPILYEDSLAVRPLFDARSADGLWRWARIPRMVTTEIVDEVRREIVASYLVLERKVRLDPAAGDKVWGPGSANKRQSILIRSRLPRSNAWEAWIHVVAGVLIAVPLFAAFWFAATFIARRVLLIDVSEPDWLAPLPLSPSLGDHIFLVRRDLDAAKLTGNDPTGNGLPFVDVSFEELHGAGGWADLRALDSSAAGRNVRVTDFEYGINDAAVNKEKLEWLERLLALPDRTVIVVSTVTPAYIVTTKPPAGDEAGAYFARWRALLDRFVCITAEELLLRDEEWMRRQKLLTVSQQLKTEPEGWLEKEMAYNSFLKQLAKEIQSERKARVDAGHFDAEADREHLLDEIGERAETYYAGLWASCHDDEKLLLFQLANHALANGRNRRLLRRLIARGLVRRDPNLELFSESFRRYVLAAAQRENLVSRARAEQGPSTWDSLRTPFFIVIVSFLALLFATQKDLLTSTTALATALTTGLPVMMKLVGVFTEKRSGASDS